MIQEQEEFKSNQSILLIGSLSEAQLFDDATALGLGADERLFEPPLVKVIDFPGVPAQIRKLPAGERVAVLQKGSSALVKSTRTDGSIFLYFSIYLEFDNIAYENIVPIGGGGYATYPMRTRISYFAGSAGTGLLHSSEEAGIILTCKPDGKYTYTYGSLPIDNDFFDAAMSVEFVIGFRKEWVTCAPP